MKINIEIQHFEGCPNSPRMIQNFKEAIKGIEDKINYKETLVESIEAAQKLKFLGSPTLLINGEDFERRKPEGEISLNCRIYPSGIPTSEQIRNKLIKLLN